MPTPAAIQPAAASPRRPWLPALLTLATLTVCAGLVGCSGQTQAAGASQTQAADPAGQTPQTPAPSGPLRLLVSAADLGTLTSPMTVEARADAADGKCMYIPLNPDEAAPKGHLTFDVELTEAKPVKFWIRAYWAGSCSNSIVLEVPGSGIPEQIIGEDGTYGEWHWLPGPTLPLEAGKTTIQLTQRQTDIRIDQILVTSNARYIPVGIEK